MLNDLDPDLIRGLPVHICLGHGVAHWARQVIPMPTKEKLGRLRDLFREWGFEFLGFFFFWGGGLICLIDLSLFYKKCGVVMF